MRKLETQESKNRKDKRNRLIIGVILIGLMLLSTAGYAFFSSGYDSNSQTGTGDQQFNGGYWIKNKGDLAFYFSTSQEATKGVKVDITKSLVDYQGQEVFVDADDIYMTELQLNLARYTERLQGACYGNCTKDLPEKTCNDNLIVVKSAPSNRVYQEQNCIFIEGDLTAMDAFLYKILDF